jgi:hypothetical protein
MQIYTIREVLSDRSQVFNVALAYGDNSARILMHAYSKKDAENLIEKIRAAIDQHCADVCEHNDL